MHQEYHRPTLKINNFIVTTMKYNVNKVLTELLDSLKSMFSQIYHKFALMYIKPRFSGASYRLPFLHARENTVFYVLHLLITSYLGYINSRSRAIVIISETSYEYLYQIINNRFIHINRFLLIFPY